MEQPNQVTLYDLERIIRGRQDTRPENSYTVKLLDDGVVKCAKKVGEEAVELALAAQSGERDEIIAEAADLLYHMLVTLRSRGISLAEVEHELLERHLQMTGNVKSDRRGT